jgi:hypothetical protein
MSDPNKEQIVWIKVPELDKTFELIDVPGDGNCLFHSLAYYPIDSDGKRRFSSGKELREHMVTTVRTEPEYTDLFNRL